MRTRTALTLSSAAVLALALAVSHGTGLVRLDFFLSAGTTRLHVFDPVLAASFAVTTLGGTGVALPLTAFCAVVLFLWRLRYAAFGLVVAVLLTQPVVELVKGVVERPRPSANAAITDAGGFSFPSGHSATSAALFGALALIAVRYTRGRARLFVAGAAIALALAVGVSRVLLGAHYPTDVLAGWLTGIALAAASLAVARRVGPAALRLSRA